MKRKLIIVSVLAVLMLVAISFSTAVSSDTTTEVKESPLYNVRTSRAISKELKLPTLSYIFKDRISILSILKSKLLYIENSDIILSTTRDDGCWTWDTICKGAFNMCDEPPYEPNTVLDTCLSAYMPKCPWKQP